MKSQVNIMVGYVPTGYAEGQCGRFGEQKSLAQLGIENLSSHFTESRN